MGMEHLQQGAQMALQAHGIVNQAKQRAMMEKLYGAQIGQMEASQGRQTQIEQIVSGFKPSIPPPDVLSGRPGDPEGFAGPVITPGKGPGTYTPEDFQGLAMKIMALKPELAMSLLTQSRQQTPEQKLQTQMMLEQFKSMLKGKESKVLGKGGKLVKGDTGDVIAEGQPDEIKLTAGQELIRKTLKEKLGREPTSGEIYKKEQEGKKAISEAGAANIQIGQERFGIQKKATAGEARTGLIDNKDNKDFYEANVSIFNTINERNEVAYWHTKSWDNKTKIIKLSPVAIRGGWTPEKIQQAADTKGKTIEEVLTEIGVIK